MKLISCYIEGFGDIKKREYRFDERLTVFCEPNGSGKSTLAAFIKAMLYGMEALRKNQKDFTDRLHYYPFDGGQFGGNLVFEMQGDTYKIERFFDSKSALQDTVTVYCNNEPYDFATEDIGKAVFGIDRASFERTAFVNGDEIEIASTSSINAKMNAFVQGADEADLTDALAALDDAAKRYKKRGDKGIISEKSEEYRAVEAEIRNLYTVRDALIKKHEALSNTTAALQKTEAILKQYYDVKLVLKDWESYESRLRTLEALCQARDDIQARYPSGLPDGEALKMAQTALSEDAAFRTEAGVSALSEEEKARLAGYRTQFSSGVPTKEVLDSLGDKIQNEGMIAHEIARHEAASASEESRALAARFAIRVPTDEEMTVAADVANQLTKAEALYRSIPSQLVTKAETGQEKPRSFKLYAILAGALIALGLGLLFVSPYVGGAVMALGGIGLLIVAFLYLNHKVSRQSSGASAAENPQKALLSAEIERLEDQLKAFLMPLGFYSGKGVLVDLNTLENELRAWRRMLEEEKKKADELGKLQKELSLLRQTLADAFAVYGIHYEGDSSLQTLRGAVSDYETLTHREEEEAKRLHTLTERRDACAKVLKAFSDTYALEAVDSATLEAIRKDREDDARLLGEIEREKKSCEAFLTEKKLTEKPVLLDIDADAEEEKARELRREIANLTRDIGDDERRLEDLGGLEATRDRLEREIWEGKNRHRLLTAAKGFLEAADKALKERYIKPVREEFLHYASIVEKALGEKVVMDHDYAIRFERGGKERSDRHLSTGQRSICAFAFRLALLLNMYPGEKPFLILDDPFTSLDAVHFEKMAELVREVSDNAQILYFTCHESRII